MAREIPVYLFTGFIDSGKTSFLQETLSDENFNDGKESTLVFLCEQGDVELDLTQFPRGGKNVHVVVVDERKLNTVFFENMAEKYNAKKLMVEYNGMWLIDKLVEALPEEWLIYQEYCFAEAESFLMYNQSMRQLVYDKLQSADVVVFNRFDDTQLDFMDFHKIVRQISRRADIFYEGLDREAHIDDVEDPLPFDKDADAFEVEDRDYAFWYRDLSEDMDSYEGKKITVKGALGTSTDLSGNDFVFGRELMNCCAEDTQMAALVCQWKGEPVKKGDWAIITGTIHIKAQKAYGGKEGPVISVEKIEVCEAPEYTVATFY